MESFKIKTHILSGNNALSNLDKLSNEKIWIGCDPFLLKNAVVDNLFNSLKQANNNICIFDDIKPEPPISNIIAGIKSYVNFSPTQVVAIGGGSAIDTVKAVRFFSQKKYPDLGKNYFWALPTTSGTGSEVTSISVISDPKKQLKYPVEDQLLLPDTAILCLDLVKSCPPKVIAYSGMDVLTHGLESLVANNASLFSDALAEKTIKLVFDNLENCYVKKEDVYFANMQAASCIGGCAFENAGLGISHALSHQIGSLFHIPHGLANAILLPKVMQFNSKSQKVESKYAAVAKLVFPEETLRMNAEDSVKFLISQVEDLAQKLNCPRSLKECDVSGKKVANDLNKIVLNAEKDFTYPGNPIVPTKGDLVKIVLSIL
ncbi:iron-containing alcohol dehydrogenase [Liquorilactobacillus ghanensis]|uniref:iron-containing alcohol dehydrogenase n=1 Tax=Liquorilactobacillus ghanensis TaxID=399370 RepID=UPI0039E9DB32